MSNSAKRTRLSGAEYKKKRIARELELSKQKDRILNFFQQVPSSNNNISSENSEIEMIILACVVICKLMWN